MMYKAQHRRAVIPSARSAFDSRTCKLNENDDNCMDQTERNIFKCLYLYICAPFIITPTLISKFLRKYQHIGLAANTLGGVMNTFGCHGDPGFHVAAM